MPKVTFEHHAEGEFVATIPPGHPYFRSDIDWSDTLGRVVARIWLNEDVGGWLNEHCPDRWAASDECGELVLWIEGEQNVFAFLMRWG